MPLSTRCQAIAGCRGSGSGARRAGYPGPPRGFCQTSSRGSGESKLPEYIAPGRRALHLVAPMRKTFVFKQTCTYVQVCASDFFSWTVHGPFSFCQEQKENGGCIGTRHHHGVMSRPIGRPPRLGDNSPAIIMAEIPRARQGTPRPCPWSFQNPSPNFFPFSLLTSGLPADILCEQNKEG